jgi:VanZ family protein
LKFLLIASWMGVLFIFTCSKSLADLLFHLSFGFNLVSHPEWSSLLMFNRADLHVPFYYVAKTGHFCGFGLLGVLLTQRLSERKALLTAFAYAVSTEILQLYFGRDGQLVDVGIDFCGILIFFLLNQLGSGVRSFLKESF